MSELGHPQWFHHHGRKAHILEESQQKLTLGTEVCWVSLEKAVGPNCIRVRWGMVHNIGEGAGENGGYRSFSIQDVELSFGMSDGQGKFQALLDQQFGCTTANQGLFIRWENYLNIPGPGIGHDGDANISIHLDDEMVRAARRFVANCSNQ